jgi:hypothetical protein
MILRPKGRVMLPDQRRASQNSRPCSWWFFDQKRKGEGGLSTYSSFHKDRQPIRHFLQNPTVFEGDSEALVAGQVGVASKQCTSSYCSIGEIISDTKNVSFCWSVFSVLPIWLHVPYVSNCKSFIERDAFWVVGGGPIMYVAHATSNVRRCIQDVM